MYSIELQTIFHEYQNKNHKMNTTFFSPGPRPSGLKKTGFNLIIFHFDILARKAVYNIRCDKYILFSRLLMIIKPLLQIDKKNLWKNSKNKNRKILKI